MTPPRPRLLIALAAVAAVAVAGLAVRASAIGARPAAASAPPPVPPYAVIASGKADVEGGVVQVAARTAGVVRAVYVQEGDRVRRGQVLAQLEDDQPRLNVGTAAAALGQAEAQIRLLEVQVATARREAARLEPLRARAFVAGQALDAAADQVRTAEAQLGVQRAAVASARAQLEAARYQLELTRVRAPADGRVVRRYANPGSGASTLNVSTLFDLEPASGRIVRAEIAEADLPRIALGQPAEIVAEADPGRSFQGRVLRRSAEFGARKLQSDDPNEKTDDRVVEVVVAAEGAPLLIGQRVLVKFLRPGAAAPARPAPPKAA